jgi:hypothetical protein
MRKLVSMLFLVCLASLALSAQNSKNNTKDMVVFSALIYDYGKIDVGSPGKCEFKFTNRMKTPLVITNVKPSCGCTIADWSKVPILPGKTGVIKLSYNTKIPGTFSKTIMVSSNAKNASVILRIKGNVIRSN